MSELKKVLGKRIREAREDKDITQKELGAVLGYSPMGISHFENGIRELKISDIQKLCAYFGKEMSFFLQPDTTLFRANQQKDGDFDAQKSYDDFIAFLDEKGY